jgi:hypothetical protein
LRGGLDESMAQIVEDPPPPDEQARRPFGISVMALALLGLAAAGWLRFASALAQRGFLQALLGGTVLYLAASGLIWGLAGLPAGLGLWFGRRWARPAAWVAGIFYPLTFWLDRVLLTRDQLSRTALPFMLGLTLAWLAWVAISLTRSSTRRFFARS